MDTERARRALEETARRQGITLEEVFFEIEEAIETAISQARREKNEQILAQWEKIPCRGPVPDAYELLAYIGEKVAAEREAGVELL